MNGAPDATMIQLRNVVKRFKTSAGEYVALRGVDVDILSGQFVAIVGKSGSGKSTMLNMITGIDHPTSGEVLVNGVNIYKMSESERSLWRGHNLGIVFQFFQLLPMLTLLENTMLPMDYCNVFPLLERPARAMELLKMVGLAEQAHKLPAAVSSGQQQAAAIARAMATDPPIIVADEPTGNLDSRSSEEIINLFNQLVQNGKTIILVTHDPTITKLTMRTLIISDGKIINETVAQALPLLNHTQMLKVTQSLEHMEIPAGGKIIQKGEHIDYFFMIAQGEVEIVLEDPKGSEVNLARLGEGEFFGEVELIHGGNSIASVRATSDGPVRLLALHHKDFAEMLVGSPLTEEAISRIVQARLSEHRAADRRKRWW
jgi:ABC-type lipoprotein export system ATPase subunit